MRFAMTKKTEYHERPLARYVEILPFRCLISPTRSTLAVSASSRAWTTRFGSPCVEAGGLVWSFIFLHTRVLRGQRITGWTLRLDEASLKMESGPYLGSFSKPDTRTKTAK